MIKKIIISFLLLFMSMNSQGQSNLKFAERVIVTSSIGLHTNEDDFRIIRRLALTNKIGVNLNKFIYVGIDYWALFENSPTDLKLTEKFWKAGPFVQFDFIPKKQMRAYVEVSAKSGTFCACELFDFSEVRPNSLNLAFGLGADFPLSKHFIAKIAFHGFFLNNPIRFPEFNIGTVGLGYFFGRSLRIKDNP